jgi:hypothetical protein
VAKVCNRRHGATGVLLGAAAIGCGFSMLSAQGRATDRGAEITADLSIDTARPGTPNAVRDALTRLEREALTKAAPRNLNDASGLVVSLDRLDNAVVAPSAAARPGQVLIDPELLARLRLRPAASLQLDRSALHRAVTADLINKALRGDVQSVDPSAAPGKSELEKLPREWRTAAASIGWTGPKGHYPEACPSARQTFLNTVETPLFTSEDNSPVLPMSEPRRTTAIAAAVAYDRHCLVAVDGGASDYPSGRIAIFGSKDRVPFCTGVHLGRDRFLTARHCFYNRETGARLAHSIDPTVSLANKNIVDAKLEVVPDRSELFGSSRDLIVLRGVGLPASVTGVPAIQVDKPAPLAKAALVGYFAAADPEKLIPRSSLETGAFPPWPSSLRATQEQGAGYCRIWDWTSASDQSGCLIHSCQSMRGFSGAPLFVQTGGTWRLAGIQVAAGNLIDKSDCKGFASGNPRSAIGVSGAIAARVTAELVQIALGHSPTRWAGARRAQGGAS